MIVRSAENAVSNTQANPSRRRAVTKGPSTSMPGLRPNSSARLTDTDGACWTMTIFEGSASAARTSSIALVSTSAPTGHTATHCPQLMQLLTLRPSSNAVPMRVLLPRPMKSIAPTACTSSHTRTHLPHRMHFAGSRTIDGLATSMRAGILPPK